MEMNGVWPGTSGSIQCAANRLLGMIEQPGLSGQLKIFIEQEMTMLKTISAALLATSLIAAPAFAAGAKNTTTPTAPTTQSAVDAKTDATTTSTKTTAKTSAATTTKSKALNANARMGKHHKKHISHLRRHKQHNVAALKTKTQAKIQAKAPVKTSAKVSLKQVPVSKRG
jgi:hypothetical protein